MCVCVEFGVCQTEKKRVSDRGKVFVCLSIKRMYTCCMLCCVRFVLLTLDSTSNPQTRVYTILIRIYMYVFPCVGEVLY